jgi:photosystem II stability/assembly factor-like uncharacterized protein
MIRRLTVIAVFMVILIATIIVVERNACGPFEDCPEWWMRRSADKLPDLDLHLYSIWASEDGGRIVAGGSQLTLCDSNDGGETWAKVPMHLAAHQANAPANNNDVIGIAFTGKRGIALLRSGEELETDGTLWREHQERSKAMQPLAPLQSAQLDNAGVRYVVASDGSVFEAIDVVRPLDVPPSVAYGSWMPDAAAAIRARISNEKVFVNDERPETLAGARALAAAPPLIGVVGADGASAIRTNAGGQWSKRFLPSREDFNAVWLNRQGSLALAAGDNGVILRSTDGGQTWLHLTFDRKAVPFSGSSRPPLWALVLNIVTFSIAVWLMWKRPVSRRRQPIERLKERFRSDRPLESERGDMLGFAPVVEALANLVRSSDTLLPIVIAVNGAFGTGKSSLSKMVGERLHQHELKIVWFDAWHHQSESDLLASLFESVRQSIGLEFGLRLKLIWIRAGMKIVTALVMASVLAYFFGVRETIARTVEVVSVAYAVFRTVQSLAVFGLLRPIAATFRLPILDAPLGLRQRFHKALGEVTKALSDRRLVIVIDADDDGRKTVLNAINFITAAADCAFILSMNRTEMKKYETLLEKIVDLNIGVPILQAAQMKPLLLDETQPVFDWGAMWRHARHVFPTIAIVITISIVLWTITVTLGGGPEPPLPGRARDETTATTNMTKAASATPSVETAAAPPPSPTLAAILHIQRQWSTVFVIVLGAAPLLLLSLMIVRRGTPPIRDSPRFTTALEIWSDVIHAAHRTPRAVKRFANRARFFALYRAAEKRSAGTELSEHAIVAAVATDQIDAAQYREVISQALDEHERRFAQINLHEETQALHALRIYWIGDA